MVLTNEGGLLDIASDSPGAAQVADATVMVHVRAYDLTLLDVDMTFRC
jgi:hypothetical protein